MVYPPALLSLPLPLSIIQTAVALVAFVPSRSGLCPSSQPLYMYVDMHCHPNRPARRGGEWSRLRDRRTACNTPYSFPRFTISSCLSMEDRQRSLRQARAWYAYALFHAHSSSSSVLPCLLQVGGSYPVRIRVASNPGVNVSVTVRAHTQACSR